MVRIYKKFKSLFIKKNKCSHEWHIYGFQWLECKKCGKIIKDPDGNRLDGFYFPK